MNRNLLPCCLLVAGLALYSADCLSQEGGGDYEPLPPHPTGFMIEGTLAQQLIALGYMGGTYSVMDALAVPNAIIGYKMRALAICLGIGFDRFHTKNETDGGPGFPSTTTRTSNTSMLFSPRFEINLYRSKQGVAEAFLIASIGIGFTSARIKTESGGTEVTTKDKDVVLGSHLGLGARAFLGGSPFALGIEFGWSGLFVHYQNWMGDTDQGWMNTHGAYGALSGTLVFD